MSTSVSIDDAQSRLREIIAALAPDEEVVITDNQQPVAKLIAQKATGVQLRTAGFAHGMITVFADDDEHLKDFQEYMP